MNNPNDFSGKPTLWQVVSSVLAAGFGVQNQNNRERDFASGSATQYIIIGIAATILFILTLLGIINLIL
ncbi:MAG: DUF2970 domain-containing protein [Methylococcaceae bacterium]